MPFGFSTLNLAGIHVAVTTSTAYEAAWRNAAVANDAHEGAHMTAIENGAAERTLTADDFIPARVVSLDHT